MLGAVAPFAGARVETDKVAKSILVVAVAPFAGARVETEPTHIIGYGSVVAPFAGARVETSVAPCGILISPSRSLRGSAS